MRAFDPKTGQSAPVPKSVIRAAVARWKAARVRPMVRSLREAILNEPALFHYREDDDAVRAVEEGVKPGDPYDWGDGHATATILHEGLITAEYGYDSGPHVWEAWERVRLATKKHNILIESVNAAVTCVYPD